MTFSFFTTCFLFLCIYLVFSSKHSINVTYTHSLHHVSIHNPEIDNRSWKKNMWKTFLSKCKVEWSRIIQWHNSMLTQKCFFFSSHFLNFLPCFKSLQSILYLTLFHPPFPPSSPLCVSPVYEGKFIGLPGAVSWRWPPLLKPQQGFTLHMEHKCHSARLLVAPSITTPSTW